MKPVRIKCFKVPQLVLIVLVSTIIIVLCGCGGNSLFLEINPNKTIELYRENIKQFNMVANFVDNRDVEIRKEDDGKCSLKDSGGKDAETKDKELDEAVNFIMKKLNFVVISKEGNYIYFVKQSGLSFDDGIAYSKNENSPDSVFIDKVIKIEKGWYYYSKKQD